MKKSNGILLFLLIAEFIVGLTSAKFICMFAYCGTNEYCVKSQIGNITFFFTGCFIKSKKFMSELWVLGSIVFEMW